MKLLRSLLLCSVLVASVFTSAAQDWAKARLEKSPRHIEWVKVKHGDREVNCSIAYPEVKDKATAVIVIHEIFGLTDWVRGVTDQLAEAGYIAIAPDLLSGAAPGGGGTAELGGGDAVRKAISSLKPGQITADLDAVADYVSKLPACNGKLVVAGFCWGGAQSFRYATHNKNLKASFVFYGTGPEDAASLADINCPVYGFYAGNDARVGATVPKTTEQMRAAGKTYEPVTYEGAGHGFMRAGEDPGDKNAANKKARDEAWTRWKNILKKI
ncbi:MAG TPA: dienelactone hydrolase family protein [Candidatus Dormibacteraeota bacterium]|nr:dienelactone hydrolase family protein [Candidatus Dormibacteraeota bacterium]